MPKCPTSIAVIWRSHANPEWRYTTSGVYYQTVRELLDRFVRSVACHDRAQKAVYNRFGQEFPLDYHICPERIELYIDRPPPDQDWHTVLTPTERDGPTNRLHPESAPAPS